MTFKESREKLNKKFAGLYHTIRYEETYYNNGEFKVECDLYVDGKGHHIGSTWEEAWYQLEHSRGIHNSEQVPE